MDSITELDIINMADKSKKCPRCGNHDLRYVSTQNGLMLTCGHCGLAVYLDTSAQHTPFSEQVGGYFYGQPQRPHTHEYQKTTCGEICKVCGVWK